MCASPGVYDALSLLYFLLTLLRSSAVMTIGTASLADIFDPVERGAKVSVLLSQLHCAEYF